MKKPLFISPKVKRAVDYLTDDKNYNHSFLKTMFSGLLEENRARLESMTTEDLFRAFEDGIDYILEKPAEYIHWEMRFCSECGVPMKEGYVLGDGENYCGDGCVGKHYSDSELDTILAGYDHTSDRDLAYVESMSEDEFNEAVQSNSDSYFTDFEWL